MSVWMYVCIAKHVYMYVAEEGLTMKYT